MIFDSCRREQLKPEASLGNALPMLVTLLLCDGSPPIGHVAHFKLTVQHRYSYLNEKVGPFSSPTHLPFFRATQARDFIDGRFGDTAADRHAAPITPSIVDQALGIRFKVPIRPTQIPP
jgi:hypothetical protein